MREPESKVAPEAISAPIPDDLKYGYELAMRHAKSGQPFWSASQTIVTLIERIASLTAQVATLESDAQQYKRKLAVLFDESTYSDSYGVEGSSFGVCRWCGGGSGPGGSAPFKHNAGCLFDDDALEAKVRDVWDEDTAIECLSLEKRIATLEKAQEIRAASIRRLEQQVATLESEKAAAHDAIGSLLDYAYGHTLFCRQVISTDGLRIVTPCDCGFDQVYARARSLSAPTKEQHE